jgi:hypothetical protein
LYWTVADQENKPLQLVIEWLFLAFYLKWLNCSRICLHFLRLKAPLVLKRSFQCSNFTHILISTFQNRLDLDENLEVLFSFFLNFKSWRFWRYFYILWSCQLWMQMKRTAKGR